MNKWRKRGLSNFRIRQLPRRRFYKAKETTESCSICLEDFQEREYLRVLPCDHGKAQHLVVYMYIFSSNTYVQCILPTHLIIPSAVFHPSCVDEWLKNWNRVCPLCKASISRSRGTHSHATRAHSHANDQQQPLLSNLESGESSIYGSIRLSGNLEDQNDLATVVISDSSSSNSSMGSEDGHIDGRETNTNPA